MPKKRKYALRDPSRFYNVVFELDGEVKDKIIQATSPGGAFAKVLRRWPHAKIHAAMIKGHLGGHVKMPVVQVTYPMVSKVGLTKGKQDIPNSHQLEMNL